jgi:hypothetical protein
MAQKLKWGRYFKSSGGNGMNIPCDLRIEHEVRALKGRFDHMGNNWTPDSAQKIARSQSKLYEIVTIYDTLTKTPTQTTEHTKLSSDLDVEIMVNCLLMADVFSKNKISHSAFKGLLGSPISQLDMANTLQWMRALVKRFSSSTDLFTSLACIDYDSDTDEEALPQTTNTSIPKSGLSAQKLHSNLLCLF